MRSPKTYLEREATHRLLECKKRVIRPSRMMVLEKRTGTSYAGISLIYLHSGMAFLPKQTNKYFHFLKLWTQVIKSKSLIRWKYRPEKFSDPPKVRQKESSKAGIPGLLLFWLGAQGSFHLTCCHPVKSPLKKTSEHVLSWVMDIFSKNSLSGTWICRVWRLNLESRGWDLCRLWCHQLTCVNLSFSQKRGF